MGPSAPAASLLACPSREALIDYDLGRLSAEDLEAVAEHVSSCPRCEAILDGLHGRTIDDNFIGLLRQCFEGPALANEPTRATVEALPRTVTFTLRTSAGEAPAVRRGPETEGTATTSIERYEVLEEIGHGGMGVVFRARQVRLDRVVAIKMIRLEHHPSPNSIARFIRREGRAVARLQHPNVVQVYELGESEGLPYLSMEYVPGSNLRKKLKGGPLAPREAAELLRMLAVTVEYAHQKDVLHRDLKPENILVAEDGTPKITDFGLAKLMDAEDSEGATVTLLTESGAALGTPEYMAPEQAEGRSDVGRPTDVYALGVILYETLAGRPPFRAKTKHQTLQLVCTAAPVAPSRLRPGVPSWLEAICLKCLEKSPEDRYPSARALADDLGLWLGHERPKGVPSWLTRAGRALRRNLAVVSAGLALTFLGGASIPIGVLINRNIAAHEIQAIQSKLAQGRAVTLIQPTGKPAWVRWRCGEGSGHLSIATDQTCNLESWPLSLVELLPDPQTGSYRVTAQIRHNHSHVAGEVGLYFAHRTLSGGSSDYQFFTQLTFNAVAGEAEFREVLPVEFRPRRPVKDNKVWLRPHVRVERGGRPPADWRLSGAAALPFKPLGEENGHWYDLELTVTPAGVTVRLDGKTFAVSARDFEAGLRREIHDDPPTRLDPAESKSLLEFRGRGGLGLYVFRGSASFRSVTVTPL
jgi:serine/threonine-protein kinase